MKGCPQSTRELSSVGFRRVDLQFRYISLIPLSRLHISLAIPSTAVGTLTDCVPNSVNFAFESVLDPVSAKTIVIGGEPA